MVLVQKWPFFQLFFLGNIGQENVFYDILERKNAFLGHKNKKFKKLKNWHFSKGVNLWFWSKNGHFSNFFFYAIYARKISLTIFYDIFPKGSTHGFRPKMAIFQTFSFRKYRPLKYPLRYSRTKKRLSRL